MPTSPRRLTTAPLALFRRGGRPCPPKNTAQRCHSEPVFTLAWESVTLRPASLCEGGGAKRRRERYAAAAPRHTGRCGHRPLRIVYRKRMRIPPGRQSRPPLHSAYRKAVRHLCGAMWASPPTYRLPKAYTLSIRADRAVRPYKGLKNTPPEVKRTKTTGRAPPQHHKRAPRRCRGALHVICFS